MKDGGVKHGAFAGNHEWFSVVVTEVSGQTVAAEEAGEIGRY